MPSELPLGVDNLVALAQSDPDNNSEAMRALLGRFEALAKSIGFKVARARHVRDDATNGARWGLVLAARSHKAGVVGFASFAKRCMYQEALRWARKDDPAERVPCDYLTDSEAEWLAAPAAEVVIDVDAALAVLKVEQREIVVRRYIADAALADIAVELGVTISAVSQRLSTIHKRLHDQAEMWMESAAA